MHVSTSRGSGLAPLPIDRSPGVSATVRLGDAVAQDIFHQVSASDPGSRELKQLVRDLAAPDSQQRSAASRLLTRVSSGPTKLNPQRAKAAACLILHTLAGLTLEEIGLVFGHDKGHVRRLMLQAGEIYREKSGTPAESLTHQADLHWRDRDRIRKKARRFAEAILRESAPGRGLFAELLSPVIQGDQPV